MTNIKTLIEKEERRQQETLDLIPSENIASSAVRDALTSVFINKYAEGYPGKRYYPGNSVADELEETVQDLARSIFSLDEGKWRVNVQPYSGSPANAAVYLGLLEFNDTILGLNLTHGGHLTHGHRVSFSGRAYRAVHYGLGINGHIDYGALSDLAHSHKPKIIISGATAYPRAINFAKIGNIAKEVGAIHMADISHIAGLVAAGVHVSPFLYADVVTTTTHKTLRGPRGAMIFSRNEFSDKIDRAVFPGFQGGPHLQTIAALGVALEEAKKPAFSKYQHSVVKNAQALASALGRRHVPMLSGGTDNHLILADMRIFGLSGRDAESRLESVGMLANRNTVPNDPSPFNPSGIRFGTPSVTSRGMGTLEMKHIGSLIVDVLDGTKEPRETRLEVASFCKKFPIKR